MTRGTTFMLNGVNEFNLTKRLFSFILSCLISSLFFNNSFGQAAIFFWDNGANSGDWNGSNGRWYRSTPTPNTTFFGCPTNNSTLRFDNGNQSILNNNCGNDFPIFQLIFDNGTSARTFNGNSIRFFDWGSTDPKIENNDADKQTFNLNISGDGDAADPLEINPVSGDIDINGTLNNRGSPIYIFGNNGRTATFNGIISGAGGFEVRQNSTAVFSAVNTYTGATTVLNGILQLNTNGLSIPTANTVTINGGTLRISNAAATSSSSNITLTTGTLALGAVASTSTTNVGTVTITGGTSFDLSAAPASCSLVVANTSGLASGNLTITGWVPSKRIIISNVTHISGVLGQINFSGYGVGAKLINTNELVPQLLFVTNGITGGDFNQNGSWLNGDRPLANNGTESIYVQPGDVLTQNTNFNVLNAQIGGTLTMNSVNTLTVSGTVTHSGTVNMVAGSVISLNSGATWAGSGGTFAGAPTGRVHFLGTGTVTGTVTFPDVWLEGGVNFGTGATIGGSSSLQINAGFVQTNPPTYASGSTLIYNSGTPFNRNDEWSPGSSGSGIPHHVRVNAGTTLRLDVDPSYFGEGRTMLGNLDVYGTLTMGNTVANGGSMAEDLVVGGTVTIRSTGTLILGCQRPGGGEIGDIEVGGDWMHETGGIFTPAQRAVIFNGSNALQSVTFSGTENFAYIVVNKPGNGNVRMNCNSVVYGSNAGAPLQLLNGNLDLNGYTMTFQTYNDTDPNTLNHVNQNIRIDGSGSGAGLVRQVFNSSGTAANFIFTHSNSSTRTATVIRNSGNASLLSFGTNVVVQIGRTGTGTSGVDFGNTISTINGTLQINAGGFVDVNPPTYTDNSLLRYNTAGLYNRTVEWGTASSGPGHPYDVQISLANTRLVAGGVGFTGTALNLRGSLTIDASTTFDMTNANATNMTVPLTAGLDINITGTLLASQDAGGTIILGRNWTRNTGGLFTHNNLSVTFNTGNLSVITGPSSATTEPFHSLIISKNAAANTVTLASPVEVSNSLTLNTGIVITRANPLPPAYTSPTFLLTLVDNATSTSGSASSFVSGPMRKIGNDAFTFPVGKYIGTEFHWRTIGVSAQSNVAEEITAEFWRDNPTNRGPISPAAAAASPGLSHISRCEYWDLTKTTAALDVNVTLSWSNNPLGKSNCNSANPNLLYVDNLAELVVVPYFNGMWGDQNSLYFGQSSAPGPSNPVSPALGYITWNGGAGLIDTYLKFTLGSTNWRFNPLPFELTKFEGKSRKSDIVLDWTVNGNDEQKEYLLERSKDGIHFVKVALVSAVADLKTASYSTVDAQPFNGLNFYRLTSFTHSGEVKKSKTIQVWFGGTTGKPGIFPNPITNNQVNIHTNGMAKGVYNIQLVGMDGKLLLQQRWVHDGNQPVYQFPLNPALARGMYWMTITGEMQQPIQLKLLK